jgi:hypothetical protein
MIFCIDPSGRRHVSALTARSIALLVTTRRLSLQDRPAETSPHLSPSFAVVTAARLDFGDSKSHSQPMVNWNDLKHFLAVARHRSTLAAAETTRVSQSTVRRWLEALEKSLGHRLVKRHPSGCQLTGLGELIGDYADSAEEA